MIGLLVDSIQCVQHDPPITCLNTRRVLDVEHRITGSALLLGAILVVWWLTAAATSDEYFAVIDGLMTSWIGHLVWIGLLWSLAYHFCNGIRHLIWDAGYGFGLDQVEMSGKITVGASVALTVLVLLIAG